MLKRSAVILGVVGLSVLAVQGCSSSPSDAAAPGTDGAASVDAGRDAGRTTPVDSGSPVEPQDAAMAEDAGATESDASTIALDASVTTPDGGVTVADSGTVVADAGQARPACYGPFGTDAEIVAASQNATTGFAYHDPMPAGTGCSQADADIYEAAFYEPSFITPQNNTAGVAGLSATCKSCLLSEFDNAVNPAGTAATKWGWSGLRTDAAGEFLAPTTTYYHNLEGCMERRGLLTNAEARAYFNLDLCLNEACPTSDNGTYCGVFNESLHNACRDYATTAGACAALSAQAQTAIPKVDAAIAAGTCASPASIVLAFCGNPT